MWLDCLECHVLLKIPPFFCSFRLIIQLLWLVRMRKSLKPSAKILQWIFNEESPNSINVFLTGIVSDMDEMDYGFEYSDEDLDEEDVAIENQYYNSKGAK